MSIGAVSRFSLPTEIVYGINTTSLLGSEIRKLGGEKAFFATDAGLSTSGILDKVYQALKDSGIPFVVFDKVPMDPTDKDIDNMADIAKREGCNCVIGAGGGSVIVACKGTALVANNEGRMLQYVDGEDKYPKPSLLCVIMPTNAGSGAEVSKGTTITDNGTKQKLRILGYRHSVRLAILDPTLLTTVPRGQSVASGVDALTHAIEAYLSEQANPITDCVALKSIEMMMTNFTRSVFTVDLEPKGQMLLGSTMANIAVSNATIGLSHILNGVITHIYEARGLEPMSYGMIHAVLLPPTLEFNLVSCEGKVAALAQAMGVITYNKSLWEIRKGVMERLDNLLTDLGAPRKLIWQDLSVEDIIETGVKIGRLSLDKQGPSVIRKYNKEDLIAILQKALP
ncbi:iron-containing alcohol dehydrogenase [Thermodesulfobacteriota bacterium]